MIEYIQSFLQKLSGFNLNNLLNNPEFKDAVDTVSTSIDLEEPPKTLLDVDPSEIYAVVIGIDYIKTPQLLLNGCVNDAFNIKEMLLNRYDVPNSNITLLTDDNQGMVKEPTFNNIKESFSNLVRKAKEGDAKVLMVTYSGHGTQTPDKNNDDDFEEDGKDECWVPSDFRKKGLFKDDQIRKYLLEHIPEDVTCILLSDSCHSGSMMDLSLTYNPTTKLMKNTETNVGNIDGNLIQISGCMDSQVAQELKINGKVSGVLSYCVTQFFKKGKTLRQIADASNNTCRKLKLAQVPLVSVNKPELLDIAL